jgi:tetratricopeptide (TPR) repeat protein
MQLLKFLPIVALALTLGCENGPPKKTASKEATERWNQARAGVFYNLASDQFRGGNLEEARKTLIKAEKMAPDHLLVRMLSAKLFIEQGSLELAEAELNTCRSIDSRNPEVDYLHGVIYQRWQKPEVALDSYIKACEKNPSELAYLLAQAEMLVQLEQSKKAIELLREKLNFFENSPSIRDALGQLLVEEGRYAEAVPMLRQASILSPEEQPIREHYGMALFYNKQYREALITLERVVKDDNYKTRADLHMALGECHMELNEPRDARDCFELASQLNPGSVSSWLNLAKAALQLNDLKRAEISLKKATSIDANSADATLLMGYLRLQQAKLPEALTSFRRASQLDPQDPVSLCMTGFVLEKMGRSNEAIRFYSQALKIKPNDELATSLMAKVQVQE